MSSQRESAITTPRVWWDLPAMVAITQSPWTRTVSFPAAMIASSSGPAAPATATFLLEKGSADTSPDWPLASPTMRSALSLDTSKD